MAAVQKQNTTIGIPVWPRNPPTTEQRKVRDKHPVILIRSRFCSDLVDRMPVLNRNQVPAGEGEHKSEREQTLTQHWLLSIEWMPVHSLLLLLSITCFITLPRCLFASCISRFFLLCRSESVQQLFQLIHSYPAIATGEINASSCKWHHLCPVNQVSLFLKKI